jgi:hypothetical protein
MVATPSLPLIFGEKLLIPLPLGGSASTNEMVDVNPDQK